MSFDGNNFYDLCETIFVGQILSNVANRHKNLANSNFAVSHISFLFHNLSTYNFKAAIKYVHVIEEKFRHNCMEALIPYIHAD